MLEKIKQCLGSKNPHLSLMDYSESLNINDEEQYEAFCKLIEPLFNYYGDVHNGPVDIFLDYLDMLVKK